MLDSVTSQELARLALLFTHLLAFAAAFVGVAFGDHALFARSRIRPELLHSASRLVVLALALLWVTGLLIVALDTGFDWQALKSRPKLLAKLTVVLALSANGMLLHRWVFPRLVPGRAASRAQAWRDAGFASLAGGFSAASWLVAAFIGLAKPVAQWLGYGGFMALYALALLAAMAVSWRVIRPRLAVRLQRRANHEVPITEHGALGFAVRGERPAPSPAPAPRPTPSLFPPLP